MILVIMMMKLLTIISYNFPVVCLYNPDKLFSAAVLVFRQQTYAPILKSMRCHFNITLSDLEVGCHLEDLACSLPAYFWHIFADLVFAYTLCDDFYN